MVTLTRQELYDVYLQEMKLGYGFGATNQWSNGPRSFAAFLAEYRLIADYNKALSLITKGN